MIEQRRQRPEILRTPPARAMIHLLLMRRRIDMRIQTLQLAEGLVAQIALIVSSGTIIRCRCRGDARRVMEGEEFLGDEVVWVAAPDLGQDGVAVEGAGVGAGAHFEVVCYACGGCEAAFAEGAGYVGAAVDFAVEVLVGVSITRSNMA
jgi:hypothetical protein